MHEVTLRMKQIKKSFSSVSVLKIHAAKGDSI